MNNKPSTYATLFTSTSDEARTFDKWFYEREMESFRPELSEPSVERGDVDLKKLERIRGDYDGNIAVGQVRILSKRFTETPDVVPFVVVLEKWEDRGGDDDMWLVAPFSPYSAPATSGEMASGAKFLWREVIQAWNSRTLQESLLKKSFLCGELCGKTVRDASALFRNQFAGTALPADFSAWRGSDVLLEFDPRRDYIAESIARLQPLSTAVKATERIRAEAERIKMVDEMGRELAKRIAKMRAKPKSIDEEKKLAAGTRKPRTECYDVGGISLDLEFSPEADAVVMTFYGEHDEKFLGYDGYGVIGRDEEFLGTFRDGSIRVSAETVRDSFMLVDRAGGSVEIKAKD